MSLLSRCVRWREPGYIRYRSPWRSYANYTELNWERICRGKGLTDQQLLANLKDAMAYQHRNHVVIKDKNGQVHILSRLITFILNDIHYRKPTARNPFNTLYKLIRTGQIKDKALLNSIKKFQTTTLSNICVPTTKNGKLKSSHTSMNLPINLNKLNNQPEKDLLVTVNNLTKKFNTSNSKSNELYQIFNNILEEQHERNKVIKSGISDDLEHEPSKEKAMDLNLLKEYLQRIEEQEIQKNAMKQRMFDWDRSLETMRKISNEKIVYHFLFDPISSWFHSLLPTRRERTVLRKEILILNLLNDKSDRLKTIPSRLSFNIKKMDAISVSNNSSLNPVVVSNKIKKLERENWKLLGHLYNENDKIIFERDINPSVLKNKNRFWFIISTTSFISVLSFFYLGNKNQQKANGENKSV